MRENVSTGEVKINRIIDKCRHGAIVSKLDNNNDELLLYNLKCFRV